MNINPFSTPNPIFACLKAGLVLLFTCLIFSTCKKDPSGNTPAEPEIISLAFNYGAVSTRNRDKKEILVYIADYIDRKNLVAIFQLSSGTTARIKGVEQKSSDTPNDFTLPVVYELSMNGKTANWTVRVESNSYNIGLGNEVQADRRLTRDYEWYQAQDTSGSITSAINGGPACIAMALNWANYLEFVGTTTRAVRGTESNLSSMYNSIVIAHDLNKYGVKWKVVSLSPDFSETTEAIDNGFLVIMQVDMKHIPFNAFPNQHVNRYINTLPAYSGHYFIVKGYKRVDGNLFYEVYDPDNRGMRYQDNGELKGRNRYYLADAVRKGAYALNGWKYAFVLHEKKHNGTFDGPIKNEISPELLANLMNPLNILYVYGY